MEEGAPGRADPLLVATVVVGSDDPLLGNFVRALLNEDGVATLLTSPTFSGVEPVIDKGTDLLILDARSRFRYTVELAKTFRAAYSIPIMLVLSADQTAKQVAVLKGGIDDVVMWPTSRRLLYQRMARLLQASRAQRFRQAQTNETQGFQNAREPYGIALVDDDRNILVSVGITLEAEGFHIRTYTDGASALVALKKRPAHLVILDIKMPFMDGMELLTRLRQISNVPAIFLTSKDDEIDELFALKIGADDFIRKPFSGRLLVERVKAVLRRAGFRRSSPKPIELGALHMDAERIKCTWKNELIELTETEFLILQVLARDSGIVKSYSELMEAAYDDSVYVEEHTIRGHVQRLRKKFKSTDRSFNMIQTVYGVGYRFRGLN